MTDPNTDYDKFRQAIVDAETASFSAAVSYANVITIGGYAAVFALWSYVKTQLTPDAVLTIALLLGVSLILFAIWNVGQMVHLAVAKFRVAKLMRNDVPINAWTEQFTRLNRESKRAGVWRVRLWVFQLLVTVPTAFAGMMILVYNCAAALFSLPRWP